MAGATLGTAYVQIMPTAKGIEGNITRELGGEAQAAGTTLGSKIGSFAKKALVAAGIATAVVGVVKGAISEGAKLQQSYLGGLDTLYGDAADGAREYAKQAAAAGISMNEYSEQAVSFGAALKAAYGGDTTKAMEAANTAILDMTDNAAKMGTPIEQIQSAYAGFSKGQYQLLDNLKLGYGGTKTEMERLLKDAEKLTGVKYDINNLGDVYDAIHAIQGNLGLTGVAAAEAAETFSGSFGAMKASAANLLGSLALGEDIKPALDTLITSVNNFAFNNLIPLVGTIIKGLPTVAIGIIKEGVPMIFTKLTSFITTAANKLTTAADSLTSGKVKAWAVKTIPKLIASAGQLLGKFASALITNLPKIAAAIGKIAFEIVKGLGSAIWPKITSAATAIKDKFMAPINTLKDKVKAIIDKIKGFFSFKISLPHIPTPHFGVNPPGWKLGDLLKGSIPKLSISWNKEGFITKGATLIGAGEAGAEALVPLAPFWKKMDEMANASRSGDVTINVYASPGMSEERLAAIVEQKLVRAQKQRTYAW